MSIVQAPVTVGEVIGGKYRVDRVVGSGGMSVVVLAWHLELEQQVALKILHGPGLDLGDAAQRFRREARAAARIRSEHVARVLDVGTLATGSPYMIMEYLEGNDLAEELTRRGPLPVEEIVEYVLQALEALAEAHAAGIVHRDLKPENLFLAVRPDGSRIIKVLDFGISKSLTTTSIADMALTKTASFVGSPLYMSPEQMRSSRSVDQRADIWSLGAILYEGVSGRLPYFADSIGELCTSLLQDVPPPLTQLRPNLPSGFEQVVMRCLEKERDKRYSSVAELARALVPFAPGSTVHADRAQRVLTMAGAHAHALSAVPAVTGDPRPRVLSSRFTASSAIVPAGPPTLASWGKTDISPALKRRGPAIALAVVAVAGVFGWMLGAQSRDPAPAVSAATPAPEAVATAVAAARAAETVAPLPSAPPATALAPLASSVQRSPSTHAVARRTSVPPARQVRTDSLSPAVSSLSGGSSENQAVRDAPARMKEGSGPRVNAWDPSTFGGRH